MTTIAFHQYCNISFIGGSYSSSPVKVGMNIPKHPHDSQTTPINNGIMTAKHSNPPKFGVSDSSASFAMARKQFVEDVIDDHTRRIKISTIGETSMVANGQPLSFKRYDINDAKRALAKVRNQGYVAPAKKGALNNPYMSGACAKRGFLPPNTSANSAGSKHSAFLSRHAKDRLACPVTTPTSSNICLIPTPSTIDTAVYNSYPPTHRNRRSTLPEDPVDMSERVNSIFMPHYIRYKMACDDCPDYKPTVIQGKNIVVDANKFSTMLPVHIKDRIDCPDCVS